eukprot:scaffold1747_cov108-Isochrysis_galbana.AAC.4
MSISSYASDHSAVSQPHSQDFNRSIPSRQSGMVQPVVEEMLATVHAAGSSLFSLRDKASARGAIETTLTHSLPPLPSATTPHIALRPCRARRTYTYRLGVAEIAMHANHT